MADKICPYADRCGGCDLQGIKYSEQLLQKNEYMGNLFANLSEVEPIIEMDNPMNYRCKSTATYGYIKGKGCISGVYAKNSHKIVSVKSCNIVDDKANEIHRTILELVKSFKIRVYDEDRGTGLLRHVQIRIGKNTGQVLVNLVLCKPSFPGKNNFVKELLKKHPEITSIVLNVNNKHTSMIMGDRNITLHGKGYIEDELCGLTFRISPTSFYQVNPVQTQVLYDTAVEFANLSQSEIVFDAYSGTGTIGLIAAAKCERVISVELNSDAVRDAIANAKSNNIKNIRFYNDDATRFMIKMAGNKEKVDCLFMDPPRSGATSKFIEAAAKLAPKKIVYISCGPESLVRDLKHFCANGYSVIKMQPVDCFPYTNHVETVCLLYKEPCQSVKD